MLDYMGSKAIENKISDVTKDHAFKGNMKYKEFIMIVLYIIITVVLFIVNFNILAKVNPENILIYGTIIFSSYIIINIIFIILYFKLLKQKRKYCEKERENEELKVYICIIEKLLDDIKKFKHDCGNTMLCIIGYIDDDNIEGLREYFYGQVLKEYKKMNSNNIYLLKNINNSGVKGLLTTKIDKCMRLGLNVKLDIFETINEVNMDTYDVCRILGILLDNALEASKDSLDQKINIGFYNEEDGICIVIANSFKEYPDINSIYMDGYSTKGEKRGMGLSIVKGILENKYNNVLLNTFIEGKILIQELNIMNSDSH